MPGCMHDYVYVYTRIYMYRGVYMCIYVYVWLYELVICYNDAYLFVRSEPSNRRPRPDLDLCSLWTRYAGDSKTDPWDDPEIRTGSCSGDEPVIRFQNRVISCECLFIGLFQFQHSILLVHANVNIILHYIVHDHAHLDNIYTRGVVFGTGMYSIYCLLDI